MNAALSNLYPIHILSLFKNTSPSSSSSLYSPNRINPSRFRVKSLVVETVESQLSDESRSKSGARRLILLRHAKSSWEDRSLRGACEEEWLICSSESLSLRALFIIMAFIHFIVGEVFLNYHDRPLSKAGKADAVNVSLELEKLGWIPELILSSDAVRTRETLKIMQKQVRGFLEAEVHFFSSFYSIAAMDGHTAEHLQQTVCKFSRDTILTVMCMGHNRGWEEAASMFSGASVELKTCNAALLESTGKSWEEAFSSAGLGGWKLQGIVRPTSSL